jgi:O-acetylhomoserine (thiol)-lyase
VGFARLGIETTFVDPADPENFARAMRPNTRAVYGETIGNRWSTCSTLQQ